ncbi:MAG: formyl transferase [Roseitalea sp.]|jgi:folate-dependent phosphoribosylglycinamide formyltransferase PurN|nr:formyl transferase [Roseitalea sp.]MBO6721281.1 formyl transferase [Roseitalea sp.]MBO6742235.1 formyl transferase [Roseitalea sp.]
MAASLAVLTAGGQAPAMIVNALKRHHPDLIVFIEPPESRGAFLKRRARKLGWLQVTGQFPVMVGSRLSKKALNARFAELERDDHVSMTLPDTPDIRHVPSGNDPAFVEALEKAAPDLLFLVGARMLKPATLDAIACPIINFHAGITPHYRGLNGGYWALAEGRPDLYGGTIHRVDAGVDTGAVIAQKICQPRPSDTIFTHQHVITAQCAELCAAAVEEALAGRVMDPQPTGPSRQYYHPTLWGWIARGLRGGVW